MAVRVLAATIGAYAIAYYLTAAGAAGLYRLSVERVDAAIMSSTLGLLVFPAISICAFGERRLWLVAAGPVLVAGALAACAALLQP